MSPRSVRIRQPIRVFALVLLSTLLAACGMAELSPDNAEKEPASVRNPQWSMRLSGVEGPVVARATDDAVVVVADGNLMVLDRRDGKRRWSRAIEVSSYRKGHHVFVADDSVVVRSSGSVAGYDLASGEQRFQRSVESYGPEEAAVLDSGLLVASCTGHDENCTVSLLDLHSGESVWQRQFPQLRRLLTPAPPDVTPGSGGPGTVDLVDPLRPSQGGEAVAVTRGPSSKAPDRATRLNVRTGAVLGTFAIPEAVSDFEMSGGGTRLVGDVILHSEVACGQYTAYDARTGAERWSRAVNQRHVELDSVLVSVGEVTLGCKSQPPAVDGGLLVSAPRHQPQIMKLSSGDPQWTAKSEGVWLGYDDGVAMAWSDPTGPYLAIDTRTDKQLWTHQPPWLQDHDPAKAKRQLTAYAVAYGQFFYSGIEDNGRYAKRSVVRVLDLRTGRPLWAAKGDNQLLGVGDDWVITTSVAGYSDPAEIRLFNR